MAKKKPEKQNKVLCEGIELSYEFFEQKESRLKTLLLKGLIVYLISMGSIGFNLSLPFKLNTMRNCATLLFL